MTSKATSEANSTSFNVPFVIIIGANLTLLASAAAPLVGVN